MDKHPLVTIGIPVYNVEPYIEKCLLSVLGQTYDNLEILVIDDLGTDNSMQMVADLQNSHPRGAELRVIRHEQNKGLGEARNTAIDAAKGTYLYFVDSDDYIEPNTVELLLAEAVEHDTDVVMASSRKVIYGSGEERPTFVYKQKEVLAGNLGHVMMARDLGLAVRGDFGLNVFNSYSLDVLRNAGLISVTASFELRIAQIKDMLKSIDTEIITYGRLPVMVSDQCIIRQSAGKCACGKPGICQWQISRSFSDSKLPRPFTNGSQEPLFLRWTIC